MAAKVVATTAATDAPSTVAVAPQASSTGGAPPSSMTGEHEGAVTTTATPSIAAAIRARNSALVRQCIAAKCDVNARFEDGMRPLHIATRRDAPKFRSVFPGPDECGNSYATRDGEEAAVAEAEEEDLTKEFDAAAEDMVFLDIVQQLLTAGADIQALDASGNTPLHYACIHGHLPTIRFILEQRVDINHTNGLGETPLFIGVSHGHRYVVLLLLEYGADSAIGSSHGSVLDEAIRTKQKDLVECIKAASGGIRKEIKKGRSAFWSKMKTKKAPSSSSSSSKPSTESVSGAASGAGGAGSGAASSTSSKDTGGSGSSSGANATREPSVSNASNNTPAAGESSRTTSRSSTLKRDEQAASGGGSNAAATASSSSGSSSVSSSSSPSTATSSGSAATAATVTSGASSSHKSSSHKRTRSTGGNADHHHSITGVETLTNAASLMAPTSGAGGTRSLRDYFAMFDAITIPKRKFMKKSNATLDAFCRELDEILVGIHNVKSRDYVTPLEQCRWGRAFHQRMLVCLSPLKPRQLEHYRQVAEAYVEVAGTESVGAALMQQQAYSVELAQQLIEYLHTHVLDPDNCLLGMSPHAEHLKAYTGILELLAKALDRHHPDSTGSLIPEEATIDFQRRVISRSDLAGFIHICSIGSRSGDVSKRDEVLASIQGMSDLLYADDIITRQWEGQRLERGDLLLALLENVPGNKLVYARYSGIKIGNRIRVYTTADEAAEVEVSLQRVLPFTAEMKRQLAAKLVPQLVASPVGTLYQEMQAYIRERSNLVLEQHHISREALREWLDYNVEVGELQVIKDTRQRLVSLRDDPPHDMIADTQAYVEQNVEQFMSTSNLTEVFTLNRDKSIQMLFDIEVKEVFCSYLRRYIQVCDSVLDYLQLQKQLLVNGTKKQEITEWWLSLIDLKVNAFLERIGYEFSAVPENYILEPPKSLDTIRDNLTIIQAILDPNDNTYDVKGLIRDLQAQIYPKIDLFIRNAGTAIADQLGLEGSSFSLPTATAAFNQLRATLDEQQATWIDDLLKDIEYLTKIKELEERPPTEGSFSDHLDIVPMSGLIVGSFYRFENELKTVLEVWADDRHVACFDSPPASPRAPPATDDQPTSTPTTSISAPSTLATTTAPTLSADRPVTPSAGSSSSSENTPSPLMQAVAKQPSSDELIHVPSSATTTTTTTPTTTPSTSSTGAPTSQSPPRPTTPLPPAPVVSSSPPTASTTATPSPTPTPSSATTTEATLPVAVPATSQPIPSLSPEHEPNTQQHSPPRSPPQPANAAPLPPVDSSTTTVAAGMASSGDGSTPAEPEPSTISTSTTPAAAGGAATSSSSSDSTTTPAPVQGRPRTTTSSGVMRIGSQRINQ